MIYNFRIEIKADGKSYVLGAKTATVTIWQRKTAHEYDDEHLCLKMLHRPNNKLESRFNKAKFVAKNMTIETTHAILHETEPWK